MDDQGRCSEGTSRARPRPWGSKLFGRPDPVGPALVELRALRSRSPRRNSVQPPASEPVLQCSRDLHRVPESADPLAKRSGPTLKVTADSQCASGRGSGGEEAQRLLFDRFEDIHEQRADDARVRSLPPPIPRAQPGGVRGGGGGAAPAPQSDGEVGRCGIGIGGLHGRPLRRSRTHSAWRGGSAVREGQTEACKHRAHTALMAQFACEPRALVHQSGTVVARRGPSHGLA